MDVNHVHDLVHHHLPSLVRHWPMATAWVAVCVAAEIITGVFGR